MAVEKWKCNVCDEVFDFDKKPSVCPVCGVGEEHFELVEVEDENDSSSKTMEVIIVGGGVASLYTADTITSKNKNAKVTIVSREAYAPYYRTRLTEIIDNPIPLEKLEVRKKSWYEERKISLMLESNVQSVDTEAKEISLENGTKLKYDVLVIASGARCFVPPFENVNLENIEVIRELEQTLDIIEVAKKSKKAVVIGGGVLGLEAGWGLKNLGLDVTIVEVMERILPRQLDEKGSEVLEKTIKDSGVEILTGTKVKGFVGDTKVEGVILEDGRKIDTDLVIISAGILPNKEFLASSNIEINRGVVVNEKMETSIKDVYACGDVAEFNGRIIGLWAVAMEQGKVAGANICGEEKIYSEQIQPLNFDGMDTKLLSIGNVCGEKDCKDSVIEYNIGKNSYRKLFFEGEVLTGALLVGDTSNSMAIMKGVREKTSKSLILNKIYS